MQKKIYLSYQVSNYLIYHLPSTIYHLPSVRLGISNSLFYYKGASLNQTNVNQAQA